MDLSRLLRPRSIAVVGATERPASYGAQALLNLDAVGYPGEVWGVNPRRASACSAGRAFRVSPTCPEAVDAVVVAIPAASVPAVVEEAGARGCGGAVVVSAGFAEVPDGVALAAGAGRRGDGVTTSRCAGRTATGSSRCTRGACCGAMR